MNALLKSSISANVHMMLTEEGARALLGVTRYGPEEFIKCFFEHLGKTYLETHVEGLRSLFKSIGPIELELAKIDRAREDFGKSVDYCTCPGRPAYRTMSLCNICGLPRR